MKNYKVSVMESRQGVYTCIWKVLSESVMARNTREALRIAAPITQHYDEQSKPELTRPIKGMTVYEYDNCKYAVEIQ